MGRALHWAIRKTPGGWRGTARIEGAAGYESQLCIPVTVRRAGKAKTRMVKVRAKGKTPAGSLAKAADLADKIASNPVLASVLPPGTATAIKATKFLAKSALKGKLNKAMKFVRGPGAKRLGKTLKKLKFW